MKPQNKEELEKILSLTDNNENLQVILNNLYKENDYLTVSNASRNSKSPAYLMGQVNNSGLNIYDIEAMMGKFESYAYPLDKIKKSIILNIINNDFLRPLITPKLCDLVDREMLDNLQGIDPNNLYLYQLPFNNKYHATILHIMKRAMQNNNIDQLTQAINLAKQKGITEIGNSINKQALMHLAARNGNIEYIELLLNAGGNINAEDNGGETPLHYAVSYGHYQFAKALLELGAYVNAKDKQDMTPLHHAVHNAHYECTELLIKNKADVNAEDNGGETPLHCAAENGNIAYIKLLLKTINKRGGKKGGKINPKDCNDTTPLHLAAYSNAECVKVMLNAIKKKGGKKGGDVNPKDSGGRTPLHYTASEEDAECVEVMLNAIEEDGGDINPPDYNGRTPLHDAASEGSHKCVEVMLNAIKKQGGKNGGDINPKDKKGRTPLHDAASVGYHKCVEKLLNEQADVNVQDNDGRTPLQDAFRYGHDKCTKLLAEAKDEHGRTSLHNAVDNDNLHYAKLLIKVTDKTGDGVNTKDKKGMTPMHYAAQNNRVEYIPILKEAGSTVDAPNKFDRTPFHYAAARGYHTVIKSLSSPIISSIDNARDMEQEVDSKPNVNYKDQYGFAAMHYATIKANYNCLEALVDAGGDVNIKYSGDFGTWRPIHFAAAGRNLNTLNTLIKFPQLEIDAPNVDGNTALHYAAGNGDAEIIMALISAKAILVAKNQSGWTPKKYALICQHYDCARILQNAENDSVINTKNKSIYKRLWSETIAYIFPKPDANKEKEPEPPKKRQKIEEQKTEDQKNKNIVKSQYEHQLQISHKDLELEHAKFSIHFIDCAMNKIPEHLDLMGRVQMHEPTDLAVEGY